MLKYSTYRSIYEDKQNTYNKKLQFSNGAMSTITRLSKRSTSKGKYFIKLLVFIVGLSLAFAGMMTVVASSPDEKVPSVPIVVQSGDTLWKIAVDHKPGRVDTRRYIHDIMKLNGLTDSHIQPGDILFIP